MPYGSIMANAGAGGSKRGRMRKGTMNIAMDFIKTTQAAVAGEALFDEDSSDDETTTLGAETEASSTTDGGDGEGAAGGEGATARKPTVQKSAVKEQNIRQMIDVLNTRLRKLDTVVKTRQQLCGEDLVAESAKDSSQAPNIEDDVEDFPIRGRTKGQARTAGDTGAAGDTTTGGEHTDGGTTGGIPGVTTAGADVVNLVTETEGVLVDPVRLVFRTKAMTESGRRLEGRFEDEFGDATRELKVSRTNNQKRSGWQSRTKKVDKHKQAEKKQDRFQLERKLQQSLDRHVTRSAIDPEVTYHLPEDGETENWPIEWSTQELNPQLLLEYSCERVALSSGEKVFRHFALLELSRRMMVHVFWFVKCKFFQDNSVQEQEHLLRKISRIYVGFLQVPGLSGHEDFFFGVYPYVLANAVFWGFFYLCPGSRHLYTKVFRKLMYLELVRLFAGLDTCPITVHLTHMRLFPDEFLDDLDDTGMPSHDQADSLPPLPVTSASHLAAEEAAAASAAAALGGAGEVGLRSSRAGAEPQSGAQVLSATAPAGSSPAAAVVAAGAAAAARAEGGRALPQVPDASRRPHTVQDPDSLDLLAARNQTQSATDLGAAQRRETRESRVQRPSAMSTARTAQSTPDLRERHIEPIKKFAGNRTEMHLRPQRPKHIKGHIPRQRGERLNTSSLSPLLQQFLNSTATGGRRPEYLTRTTPVPWCRTGGTDTHSRVVVRKELHDRLSMESRRLKKEEDEQNNAAQKGLKHTLSQVNNELNAVLRGGSGLIGKMSQNLVKFRQMEQAQMAQSQGGGGGQSATNLLLTQQSSMGGMTHLLEEMEKDDI